MKYEYADKENFLFRGTSNKKFLQKSKNTKILLDHEFIWLSGFQVVNGKLSKKLIDIKMKYSNIESVEINQDLIANSIRIQGKLYKKNQHLTVHVPYIRNFQEAIAATNDAIHIYKLNQKNLRKELELLRSNK